MPKIILATISPYRRETFGYLGIPFKAEGSNVDESQIERNNPEGEEELEFLRYCVNKGKPYGSNSWMNRMIDRFNLGFTLRGAGRPINRS